MRLVKRVRRQSYIRSLAVIITCVLIGTTLLVAGSLGLFQGLLPAATATLSSTTSVPAKETTASAGPSGTSSATSTASTTTVIEPTQVETDPAKLLLPVRSLPGYLPAKSNSNGSFYKTFTADNGKITWWIYQDGNQLQKSYQPDSTIAFPSPAGFSDVEGVLTFRGNNFRDAPSWGTAAISQKKLEIVWTKDIGAISGTGSYWPGAGWTGQPLLVHWPQQTRQVMGIKEEFKSTNLVEVIYPVFDGNIYFLDLLTGKATRDPIKVGYGFKGTGSVDPRGYPLFYAGQGLNDTNGKIGPFKYRMFDLIQNKEVYGIPGADSVAYRTWGAFDPSAIIDRQTDTLIEPGENGVLYKTKLNTIYDPVAKTITINPSVTKFVYKLSYHTWYGVESSPLMYRNLLYFADNGGTVVCMDINTLEPVWMYNTLGDGNATMVMEETADGVSLYQGNTVDQAKHLNCNLRKFDAITGKQVWQYDIPTVYDSNLHGGMLATPLIGKDDISDLVIFNVARTKSWGSGTLVALNKDTGKPVWTRDLTAYSWSSPISIEGDDGKSYGVFCDSAGDMHLFDPRTGKDLDVLSLGKNVEASPSAYDNMIVVASYAQKIFGIKIK
jgi:outer membrane protein assembly factor BamB